MRDLFTDADVIHSYSRAQALADGVLRDVTATAREAGIWWPVAVTAALWLQVLLPLPEDREAGQSEAGRLWDVLWILRHEIRAGRLSGAEGSFRVLLAHGRKER